jgi:hypothetical protein
MQAPNVSNEELKHDIYNTERESDAYYNISQGFLVLSQLPENSGHKEREYIQEYEKYKMYHKECENFINKLYEIKKERAL